MFATFGISLAIYMIILYRTEITWWLKFSFIVGKWMYSLCMYKIQSYICSKYQYFDQNHIAVSYQYNGKTYNQLVDISEPANNIYVISDENGNDVTQKVKKYLNPSENINSSLLQPYLFGCQQFLIEKNDGSSIVINNCSSSNRLELLQ